MGTPNIRLTQRVQVGGFIIRGEDYRDPQSWICVIFRTPCVERGPKDFHQHENSTSLLRGSFQKLGGPSLSLHCGTHR